MPALAGADRWWQNCTVGLEEILAGLEARTQRSRPGSRVITGSRPAGPQAGVESNPGDTAWAVKTENSLGRNNHE